MAKRGFFAELQHQKQVAARQGQQQAQAAERARATAMRKAEVAQRQSERARSQADRASDAQRKHAQQEAQRLHEEALHAEAASRNSQLAADYAEIDAILSVSLDVDGFVDLEQLRTTVRHPPFDRTDLEQVIPPPAPLVAPPPPRYVEPDGAPRGLAAAFGPKKHYAERVAQAQAAFAVEHQAWQAFASQLPVAQLKQMQDYQVREQQRLAMLGKAREVYEAACLKREAAVRDANSALDALIAGLADDDEEAVQEYVSIVLSRSVYPNCFAVAHDFEFASGARELSLTVTVPLPADIPSVKEYKYVKAKDEIVSTPSTQKDRKDRYASAIHQVALRTMREVFEADRDGRIQTISLTLGADTLDTATGLPRRVSLVAVASDRASFTTFDLSNVVPLATLQHLNALVSKNPFELVEIDLSKGVRGK